MDQELNGLLRNMVKCKFLCSIQSKHKGVAGPESNGVQSSNPTAPHIKVSVCALTHQRYARYICMYNKLIFVKLLNCYKRIGSILRVLSFVKVSVNDGLNRYDRYHTMPVLVLSNCPLIEHSNSHLIKLPFATPSIL